MLPLEGTTVVDAGTFISAPLAAQALAEMGADVVKVEAPAGDGMRRFGRTVGGLSLLWLATNRSRRFVTADLATLAGRDTFDELLADADVLLTNWRPGVAERLGLAAADVEARHPRLVWCRVTGFGQDGPRAGSPAYDTVVQATTGLTVAQGGGGEPQPVRSFLADKVTAGYATQAVLAALVRRASTGRGGAVDVAMLDALAHFDWPDLGVMRALPDDHDGDGVDHQLAAVRPVPTADGWVVVAAVRGDHVKAVCELAGHPEWLGEILAGPATEIAERFYGRLATVFPSAPSAHWLAALAALDVPAAEVLDLDGHLADPQVRHNRTYATADHPVVGRHRYARHPARWAD
ncbi:MAG TPA: CoA transferase [Acidimicrobiales bacterium]|nr:CoA transferase [Acidimicrobiales bacterium]